MRTFTFGNVTVTQVTELVEWRFPARGLYPGLTDEALAKAARDWGTERADDENEELMLDINCYLVKTPTATILVDSGNGNDKARPIMVNHHMFDTDFLEALAATGTTAEDIDAVVSTHLHQDHCGWNTKLVDGKWVPTFINADHYFSRVELDHVAEYGRTSAEGTLEYDFYRTWIDTIQPVLLAGLGRILDEPHTLYEDETVRVWVEIVAGHTPGHLIVRIDSKEGSAVISGDVIHHPLQLNDFDLVQVGDVDAMKASDVRRTLINEAADRDLLLLTAHFPNPGKVRRSPNGEFLFESLA